MNFATTTSLNFGSGRISRLRTNFFRPMNFLYCKKSLTGLFDSASKAGFINLCLCCWSRCACCRCSSAAGSSFGAVFGAALLAVRDALGVERAANGVIPNTGKVLHAASADQHDRVLLKIVSNA